MVVYHPQTKKEAVEMRVANENSRYLAGGTDDLRLGGDVDKDTILIDVNPLLERGISDMGDGIIKVGALTTFNDMIESPLVSGVIKEACRFNASFTRRNSATIGGNIALKRDDSYLLALFVALGVTFNSTTLHCDGEKSVEDYAHSKCKRLINYFLIDTKKKAWVKRFGLSSTTHAALIGAVADDEKYALSVHGSAFVSGTSPDIWKEIEYTGDITGSAEYKEYLAKTVFTLRRDQ